MAIKKNGVRAVRCETYMSTTFLCLKYKIARNGNNAKHKKQTKIVKGADKEPKPIGDHNEKQIVAIIATVGGATNIEMKLAKSCVNSFCEFCPQLLFSSIQRSRY